MKKDECIPEKIVRIRHATESDMFLIEHLLKKHRLDTSDLNYNEFVVAIENSDLIGLGRINKIGEVQEIGCINIIEERKGIGLTIAKHLLHAMPVKMVYVTSSVKGYFEELGFVEMKEGSKELYEKLDSYCKISSGQDTLIMVREKA
jgi:N-acetylglutamate synthase-like GNAT family acetyltransferase